MSESTTMAEIPDFKGLEVFEVEQAKSESAPDSNKTDVIPENVELMPSAGDDIMVFARTPEEMARAQNALIAWSSRRLKKARADLQNATNNWEEAKSAKIRTAGWRREMKKYEKEINFYTKVQDALEAGYFIVPDFPITTIGIRTMETERADGETFSHRGSISSELHGELPAGDGHYVDPVPQTYSVKETITRDGKENTVTRWTAGGTVLKKMDFPFRLIKPHLLKDLNKATELKIFDAIGVLPGPRKSPDPMLLGVIENRIGRFQSKRILFLISWWVPTSAL